MAKKEATVVKPERGAKSNAIRAYLAKNPNAGPTEVSKALLEQGLTVDAAFVSTVKQKLKSKTDGGATVKPRKSRTASVPSVLLLSDVTTVLEFVKARGGYDKAHAAISEVEQFQATTAAAVAVAQPSA